MGSDFQKLERMATWKGPPQKSRGSGLGMQTTQPMGGRASGRCGGECPDLTLELCRSP